MKLPIFFLLFVSIFTSCWKPVSTPEYVKVWGYRPIYTDTIAISLEPPRAMLKAGKIYVKDKYIYQLDQNSGIHVFDKTDPSALEEIGFINVQGASEISISGNNLITNVYADLVVIDIADLQNIKLVSRVKHAFNAYEYEDHIPTNLPEHGVYYECIQGNMGVVKEWVRDSVYNMCYFN